MDKILQMLELQQQLNDATNGEGWEKGVTKNGKQIDWRRCSYLECAELIDSYPWKHWKDIAATPDYENIKIEAVDIWHFIMSQGLQEYKVNHLGSIETLARNISDLPNFAQFEAPLKPHFRDDYAQIEVVEELIRRLFCDASIEKIIEAFLEVAMQSGLNLDSLYQLYIGKNILNTFRQDHGYKEGTYVKTWSDREDNVVMQTILEANPDITPAKLYEALQEAYPKA